MEFFSAEFFSALLAILVIDLVLAGDNAIVIGLAARRLPKEQQKKVIIWGTVGAILIRIFATLIVVWLLNIPGLLLVGGLLLIWIAYKLLVEEKNHDHIKAEEGLWAAIRTIVIADAVMGLDNVLAVAGAAHGSFLLVVLGLLISVPVVVWGSTLIIGWIERFPSLIYVGSGVIAWTAAKMIIDEPFIASYFDANPVLKWGFTLILIAGVLLAGRRKKQGKAATNS
ncbi:TerC family protein [Aneurinibacillus migulanus]|uniref:TerC family protein n=1 Tax=Aneurinibacillus migulanus TaxID=47500 RepID=UPI0020A21A0E|nr:TerC family protein [Aneurinibacillus migulanus]MCP1358207.1 TerC family protein [Aneurinibacillus migulanus]MED4730025.1 TerC family protein [Aneurinibacillus migulanus]